MGVSIFAEFSDNFRVIMLVMDEEIFSILVGVNFNFSQSIMHGHHLVTFRNSTIQPIFQNSHFISFFKFLNKRFYGAVSADIIKNLFDIIFVTFQID